MTPTSLTTPAAVDLPEAGVADARTLAGEHALLMRDVERRAEPVLALLATQVWPHAELGTLTAFLRSAVLRQVSDEETLLFPHDASAPPFAELSADHVRLHALTTRLEQAYRQPCARVQLRTLVDELLVALRRHLTAEQAVLAALPDVDSAVPSAADLAAGTQAWMPEDHAPVLLDLDLLPDIQAIELCIERLLRLVPGQSAELHSHDDLSLRAICRWLHDFDAARYGISHTTVGQDHLLRITCRPADAPAGIS